MRAIILLALCVAAVAAVPRSPQRIVGGSVTNIGQYPFVVALLYSWNQSTYWQACGGTILATRFILTAAFCPHGDPIATWRVRVGSSYANNGGVTHNVQSVTYHPNYDRNTRESDIAILRTTIITLNNNARPATIATPNYVLADNQILWAVGWGDTLAGGPASEQLRQVQVWSINQSTCASRYAELWRTISANMLCSGWLDLGGRDQCQGDDGGPVFHNGNVVGISSWGESCGLPRYPRVNTRVSRFTAWIRENSD